MNNRRIGSTLGFASARALARITCLACAHVQVFNQAQMLALFPMVMPLDMAEKKLKCSACGEKRARISPVPEPGR